MRETLLGGLLVCCAIAAVVVIVGGHGLASLVLDALRGRMLR